jgi:NAD(P)-dependent dehydrogenase (short-subunit alcohol dehydrogenase family)
LTTHLQAENVCVVTGASRGIGQETALGLARKGRPVIMVARDTPALAQARAYVSRISGNPNVHIVPADLSEMTEVRRLAEEIIRRFSRVDVLVHAAGVILPKRQVNRDGFEMTFATNVMAPFLLSHLLLGALQGNAPSRVLFFYGGGRGTFDLHDLMSEHRYDGWRAYNQSKNADVMVSLELSRRWEGTGVAVNCAFPGIVKTDILSSLPKRVRFLLAPFRPLLRTAAQGAVVPVWAATASDLRGVSGKLLGSLFGNPCREFRLPPITREPERRRQLFDRLLDLTGMADGPQPRVAAAAVRTDTLVRR